MKSQNVQKLPTPQTSTKCSRPLPPHTGGRWGGPSKKGCIKMQRIYRLRNNFWRPLPSIADCSTFTSLIDNLGYGMGFTGRKPRPMENQHED